MTTVHKHECPPLPPKTYVEIELEPTAKLLKVASSIQRTAMSTIEGLNQLRQLSDGFLYREVKDGEVTCPTCQGTGEIKVWYNPEEPDRPYGSIELMDPEVTKNFTCGTGTCSHCMGEKVIDKMVRQTVPVPCPKVDVIRDLLEKAAETTGRIILFAGFQGSVDRLEEVAREAGWEVFRCDGRGSLILDREGKQKSGDPLRYWKDLSNPKVAFIANPESGGFGLTLVESNIIVFYSNSYKPEFRLQAEERAHRRASRTRSRFTTSSTCRVTGELSKFYVTIVAWRPWSWVISSETALPTNDQTFQRHRSPDQRDAPLGQDAQGSGSTLQRPSTDHLRHKEQPIPQ